MAAFLVRSDARLHLFVLLKHREVNMTTVVCSTSMASAFNVVLNLACIWLLFVYHGRCAEDQG
jgi:hypothetical protein